MIWLLVTLTWFTKRKMKWNEKICRRKYREGCNVPWEEGEESWCHWEDNERKHQGWECCGDDEDEDGGVCEVLPPLHLPLALLSSYLLPEPPSWTCVNYQHSSNHFLSKPGTTLLFLQVAPRSQTWTFAGNTSILHNFPLTSLYVGVWVRDRERERGCVCFFSVQVYDYIGCVLMLYTHVAYVVG